MKILFINISDIRGGSAIVAYRLAQSLNKKHHTENLFLVRSKYSNDPNVIQTRKNKLEEKIEWGTNIIFNVIGLQYKYLPFSPKRILKVAKEFKPDIINLHNTIGGYFNINDLIPLSKIAPIVWTLHDMWAFTGNAAHTFENQHWKNLKFGPGEFKIYPWIGLSTGNWLLREKKKIYNKSRIRIIVPSSWMKEQAEKSLVFYEKKIDLIYHGIDLNKFKKLDKKIARKNIGIPVEAKVIMFSAERIGRNIFKGGNEFIDILININKRLKEKIYLLIIGKGVIKEINSLRNFFIINTGYIEDEGNLPKYYSAADVFIYPTKADSFGLVLLESIACGTPCVTFGIGGCTDIIKNDITGFTIKPFNIDEFTNKVLILLKNKTLHDKLSENSVRYSTKYFSINDMVEKYYEIFKQEAGLESILT